MHIFLTQSLFQLSDYNIELGNKLILLQIFFRFSIGFFQPYELFYILKYALNTCNVIFHSFKRKFQNPALNIDVKKNKTI